MRGWLCATQRVLRTAPSRLARARAFLLVSPTRIVRSQCFERFPRAFRGVSPARAAAGAVAAEDVDGQRERQVRGEGASAGPHRSGTALVAVVVVVVGDGATHVCRYSVIRAFLERDSGGDGSCRHQQVAT